MILRLALNGKHKQIAFKSVQFTRIYFCTTKNGNSKEISRLWNAGISKTNSMHLSSSRKASTFPNVLDYTNCRDYLREAISKENNIVSNDWIYLLEQIVDTIPAEPSHFIDEEDWNDTITPHELGYLGKRNIKNKRTVKPYYCHSFGLTVCAELGNVNAALALLECMKKTNEPITNIHRSLVFTAFWKNFICGVSQKQSKFTTKTIHNLGVSEEETDQILNLCKDAMSSESDHNSGYNHVMVNVATTMAYTRKWMDGYELWNKLRNIEDAKIENLKRHDAKTATEPLFMHLHKCTKPLAFAALENGRDDVFWTILNDSSFHLNHLYLRDGLNDARVEENNDVFIHYIMYCTKVKFPDRPLEAYDAICQLFEFFRKHYVLINDPLFDALSSVFLENVFVPDTPEGLSNKQLKCTKVLQNKFGTIYKCNHCLNVISSPALSEKDIEKLKESTISRLIIKDDVYQSSDPNELKKFETLLSRNKDYDIVIDGLNICGLGIKIHKQNNRRRLSKDSFENQSYILVTVLRKLHERGLKVLLIHRKHLKRYIDFPEISKLCKYVILENTSEDDPFFIAAALNSGPRTLILTNDLLRQHNFALQDPYLRKLFSYWQMQCQVYCKWLSYESDKSEGKGVYNEADGQVRKVQLYFPSNYVLRATRTSNGWHIPIAPPVPKTHFKVKPVSMIRPRTWACIF